MNLQEDSPYDGIRNIVDQTLISVDISNLGACNYASDSALYNLGGIVNGDDQDTVQA
jgi:hypothetical protein